MTLHLKKYLNHQRKRHLQRYIPRKLGANVENPHSRKTNWGKSNYCLEISFIGHKGEICNQRMCFEMAC